MIYTSSWIFGFRATLGSCVVQLAMFVVMFLFLKVPSEPDATKVVEGDNASPIHFYQSYMLMLITHFFSLAALLVPRMINKHQQSCAEIF